MRCTVPMFTLTPLSKSSNKISHAKHDTVISFEDDVIVTDI